MMMQSQVNLTQSTPWGKSLTKITELPVVGNKVLQLRVNQMSVQQLKQLLDQQAANVLLIDVRYQSEVEIAQIPGAVLVPFPELKSGKGIAKIQKLIDEKRQENPGSEPQLVIMCKAGVRSAKAVALLKPAGIDGFNLTGGIDAWSKEVDPSVPQYSIKDVSEFDALVAKQRQIKQRCFTGGGLAIASFAVAAVFAAPHASELNIAQIQTTASLNHVPGLANFSAK